MNVFTKFWNWYKSHESVQWALIMIPLWLQPLHMIAMGETIAHVHGVVDLDTVQYHLAHWNFWVDIFWLSIDYLEWIAIITGTEKFIRWFRVKRQQKALQLQKN